MAKRSGRQTLRHKADASAADCRISGRSGEAALSTMSDPAQEKLFFRLFISSASGSGETAPIVARQVLEGCLDPEDFELEVCDVCQEPALADESGILATPTLVRLAPPPEIRAIGDLSNIRAVLAIFGLKQKQ
jgi:circadian clock protein KaiB